MKNKFTADDLRPGYIVKLGNGDYRLVTEIGKRGSLILVSATGRWDYLSHWNYDLTATVYTCPNPYTEEGRKIIKDFNIVEVYGLVSNSEFYRFAAIISTAGRDLLWSRTPTVKMTVSEISKKLGYNVEIIAESEE